MTSNGEIPGNVSADDLNAGADNLLVNTLGLKKGDSVLLVLEPDESLYDNIIGKVFEQRALFHGASVQTVTEPLITKSEDFPKSVALPMQSADHTIFLSRVGDYVRFVALPGSGTKTTSYTLDASMLGSPYATVSSQLMARLLGHLEDELMHAKAWRIRCPLGTDISGTFNWPSLNGNADDEILVALFPVSTFKPVPSDTATGRVALSRWLMPGAAAKLDQATIRIPEPIYCEVEAGQITGFSGSTESTKQVAAHYDHVANSLNIARNRVHSWHVGINPQTFFDQNVDANLERWSAISFGSPRYLHFHTCGDEPPGEIAWSIFDPTIIIDDQVYWANGEFMWLRRVDNKALILNTPGAEVLLSGSRMIGV